MRALLLLFPALLLAQAPDISGTWVAKREGPMGEMELVWRLKVADGKITGTQTMGFGDAAIVDGSISGDTFELTLQGEGGARATTKGRIVGDTLEITPGMPPRRPGGGMGPGGPGGGAARDADAVVPGSGDCGLFEAAEGAVAGVAGVAIEWVGEDAADGVELVEQVPDEDQR